MTNDRRTDRGPMSAGPREQAEHRPAAPADRTPLLAVGGAAPLALLLVRRGRGHRP